MRILTCLWSRRQRTEHALFNPEENEEYCPRPVLPRFISASLFCDSSASP